MLHTVQVALSDRLRLLYVLVVLFKAVLGQAFREGCLKLYPVTLLEDALLLIDQRVTHFLGFRLLVQLLIYVLRLKFLDLHPTLHLRKFNDANFVTQVHLSHLLRQLLLLHCWCE